MKQLSIILLFISVIMSQSTDYPLDIKTQHIKSKYLNTDREYYVYLPENYTERKEAFDVLYILDGQWFFLNGVSIQKSLRVPDLLPELIIVGIKNQNPLRRKLFSNLDAFLSFMQKELIPQIDKSYRTTSRRILFGWEMSAFFSSQVLFDESNLFEAVIATNGSDTDSLRIEAFSKNPKMKQKYLYLATSEKDIYTLDYTLKMEGYLKRKNLKNLNWKLDFFNEETHESLNVISMYHGLRFAYQNFETLSFSSIESFKLKGGMDYLKDYYQIRSKRFAFADEVHNDTKNNLIWLAWNRDNFKYFDFFMNEFKDVLKTKRYASSYWQNRFGQFYLKYKNLDKAIFYFNNGLDNYTKTAEAYNGLGHAYAQKSNMSLAISNYEKAVELAKSNKDRMLERYEKDLKRLKY